MSAPSVAPLSLMGLFLELCLFFIGGLPVKRFNPNESRYRFGLAIIGFKDADINVNNGEVDEETGSGVLILFHYLGEYDLNYDEKTMMLDGNAWLIRVNLD